MLAVVGAGPHGRELAHLLGTFGVVLLDDNLPGHRDSGWLASRPEMPYVAGAAWPKVRRQIVDRIGIHQALDDGRVIFPGVQIGQDVIVGKHTHIGYNATVCHGCQLGDFVTVSPGVTLSGEVMVEDGAFIGAGATVIHGGIIIGENAVVGAGSVVLRDVPANTTVAGNPATNLTVRAA